MHESCDWKTLVRARIGPLRVDPAREADIVDELAQHVAEEYADLRRAGHTDAAAREMALAPLADRARVAADIARADRPRPAAPAPPAGDSGVLTGLARDVRYAARVLMKTPTFTAVALVTLALGIGANTAIFSVVNAVLLQPLPYTDPDRLVMIGERGTDRTPGNTGYTTFADWRDGTRSFEDMSLVRLWQPTLVANGEPERLTAMRVSWNFFRMLGVRPAIGRDFRQSDDTIADWRVAVISDGLWRRRFSADPAVVGRVVSMNDQSFTVIGVMPPTFEPLISEHFYERAELWAALGYDRTLNYACRDCQHLKAFARLKPGVSIDAARADVEAVQTGLRAKFPTVYSTAPLAVVPIADELMGDVRPALAVLMGAVGVVLLIACANVANLLLARLSARERDLALRAALGASRARLVRQLLVESAVLAFAGGIVGVALSGIAVPILSGLAPTTMARFAGARLDARVLGFSTALSVLTAFVFGLVPAVRASRVDLQASLHGGGRRTSHASTSAARRLLVAADVAMAVVLLIGAGLMIRSVGRLIGVNPGFDADRVLTMQISMVGRAYAEDATVVAKTDAMLERLRAVPGVEAVAAAGQIPLGGNGDRWGFHVEGRAWGPQDPSVERYSVTPDYFPVMRIPLVRGRLFTTADRAGTESVMIIGERTARQLWPGGDPLGQHVKIGGTDGRFFTIVGVVGDVRHSELASAPTPQMYLPQAQVTDSFLTFVLRSGADTATLAAEARQAIWSVAPDVPVYRVARLADLAAKSVGPRRFVMLLLEVFGGVALLMTAVGVYGVIAYSVAERTREIGIRAALGATPRDIARLVVGGGLVVVVAGLAAGLLAAMSVTRYLEASLFEVRASDPVTFAVVVLVLFAVTLVAQAVPLLRAIRVAPTVALRQE